MLRKVFRTGNSMVVSLPRDVVEPIGLAEGAEVSVEEMIRWLRETCKQEIFE
jgi:antitoxin component of MazEF toxin-antitoxin module